MEKNSKKNNVNLDNYIETVFIPKYVKVEKNNKVSKEIYPSIDLDDIINLSLSHDDTQYVIYYLDNLGIKIRGYISVFDYDIPNYDYLNSKKKRFKEKYKKDYEEELELFRELKVTNDKIIREKIIINNMRLAEYIAYKYSLYHQLDREELESYAYEGLINAVDKFDYSLGNSFSTYAYPLIESNVKIAVAAIIEKGKIRRNNYFYEVKPYVDFVEERECKTLREEPSLVEEVLKLMVKDGKITLKKVNLYRKYLMTKLDVSLDTEVQYIIDDGNIENVLNNMVTPQFKEQFYSVLNMLTDIEKIVIIKRFGLNGEEPLTLDEISKIIGLCKSSVAKIEKRTLLKLKVYSIKNGYDNSFDIDYSNSIELGKAYYYKNNYSNNKPYKK